jgi:hypothetical protein
MQEEKLKKVCDDFSLLNEEQQNYILGIMQALVFAKNTNQPEQGKNGSFNSVPEKTV